MSDTNAMRRSPLALLFFTVTLDLIGFGMVVPLMPLYAERLAASGRAIAWLLSSYSLMQFVWAPLWGRLSDKVGRRPVLIVSLLANAACLLAFACSRSYGQLLAARLGAGVFAANVSVASAYVADVTPAAQRARGMGAIGAAFGLGFVLGPFFAGELSVWGMQAPPLCAAALAALNGLLALVWLPESLPVSRRKKARTQSGVGHKERWASLRRMPRLWPLLTLVFLQIAGFSMMEMALALFCEHDFGLAPSGSGRLLAFVGFVLVAVQGGLVGPLVRRFGEAALVLWGLLLLSAGLMALPATALHMQLAPLCGCLAVIALAQGLVSPALSALISRSASAEAQGAALGLAQSASALARAVGPAIAGGLFDRFGGSSPFLGGGTTLLMACALALWSLGPKKHKPMPAHEALG